MTALENLIAAYLAVEPETLAPAEYIAAAREEQRELIEGLNAALLALDYQRLASSTTIPKTKQGRWDAGSSIEEYLDQVRQEEERARALLAKHKEPTT